MREKLKQKERELLRHIKFIISLKNKIKMNLPNKNLRQKVKRNKKTYLLFAICHKSYRQLSAMNKDKMMKHKAKRKNK